MQPERPSFNDAISNFNDVISIWDLSAHFLIGRAHAPALTEIAVSCLLLHSGMYDNF